MRVFRTTLLVVAVLAAGPATSRAQLPPVVGDPVRQVVDQLPPPVRDPVRGIVDQLPPLPVQPPALPELPAPDARADGGAARRRGGADARADPRAGPRRRGDSGAGAAARPAAAAVGARRHPGARLAPGAPPRSRHRRARSARASVASAPPRARHARAAGPPRRVRPSRRRSRSQVTGDVGEIIRAVPPAVLWALAGIVLIAIALAINAYWQSRRRTALEAQRAGLLDDIGLLSRALLPAMPEGLGGVAVSAAYRPADGPAAGGDFYDVFTLGEERICVLLGDVSGHGRESVTQAALARYTLRTLLAAGHPPGEALARADVLLARELQPNFVTVIAGIYDPATGELTYAKAGHAPPIVLGDGARSRRRGARAAARARRRRHLARVPRARWARACRCACSPTGCGRAGGRRRGSGAPRSSGCSRPTTSRTPAG